MILKNVQLKLVRYYIHCSNMIARFTLLDRLRAYTTPHRFRAVLCEKRVAKVHPANIMMFGFCLHRLGRQRAYQCVVMCEYALG